MYPLRPRKVYVSDEVDARPAWRQRTDRILDATGFARGDVVAYARKDVPEVVADLRESWPPAEVPDGVPVTFTRPLVFTTIELSGEVLDVDELVQQCPEGTSEHMVRKLLGGWQLTRPTHPRERDAERDQVCWPTCDFGVMNGCPHGCRYCGSGRDAACIAVGVNLEEYMQQVVVPMTEKYPWQRCFRMIGWGADLITFEPEYGLFDLFTRTLADCGDLCGYFHTASDNVDWMAGLPRLDRLIGVWSVTCEAVARRLEPGSGSAVGRLDAAARCAEMGLPVRHKFKPIIPIRGWREQYVDSIEEMFRRPVPESIGMCVLGWMSYQEMVDAIDPALLDPEYVDAARDAADEMAGMRVGPFPHDVRAEIYRFFIRSIRRHDADVPLYVSTESREMWDELADELGQDPEAYVCGCSPVALPGGKLALSRECPWSTYKPLGSAG